MRAKGRSRDTSTGEGARAAFPEPHDDRRTGPVVSTAAEEGRAG